MCRTEEKTHYTMHTVFCRYRDTRRDVCCNAHTPGATGNHNTGTTVQHTHTQHRLTGTTVQHTHNTDSQKHQEALTLQSHTPSTRDTRMDIPRHLHAGGVCRQTGTPCNTYTHHQIHLTMRHIPYKLHTSPGTEIHRDSHTKKHTQPTTNRNTGKESQPAAATQPTKPYYMLRQALTLKRARTPIDKEVSSARAQHASRHTIHQHSDTNHMEISLSPTRILGRRKSSNGWEMPPFFYALRNGWP